MEGDVDAAGHRDLAAAVALGRRGVVLEHVADVAGLPAGVPDHVARRWPPRGRPAPRGGRRPRRRSAGAGGPGRPAPRPARARRRPRPVRWRRRSPPPEALDLGDHLSGGGVADVHGVIFADGGPACHDRRRPTVRPRPVRGPAGTVRDRARAPSDTERPVQPGQGLRHARRDPGRPGVHRVARPPPHLRPGVRALTPAGRLPARPGPARAPRACRAPGLGVGAGPRRARALQRQRVPRGDAGLVPGPGRALQRQLPLRRRGAALPAQRRPAPGHDPALLARPDPGRGAAHAGRAPRRAAPGGRRIGPRPPPRGGVVRGGIGRILARGRAGRAVPRRPLHPLHGGHDRHAQGRAVAPARHLHGRHGRAEGGHVGDRDELRGHHRAAGRELPAQADAPAAAHARRGAVGRLHADGPGGDAHLPRRHAPGRPRRRVVHRRAGEGATP